MPVFAVPTGILLANNFIEFMFLRQMLYFTISAQREKPEYKKL